MNLKLLEIQQLKLAIMIYFCIKQDFLKVFIFDHCILSYHVNEDNGSV